LQGAPLFFEIGVLAFEVGPLKGNIEGVTLHGDGTSVISLRAFMYHIWRVLRIPEKLPIVSVYGGLVADEVSVEAQEGIVVRPGVTRPNVLHTAAHFRGVACP
jgi:hypothetical protein